jgi:hypothetical protein
VNVDVEVEEEGGWVGGKSPGRHLNEHASLPYREPGSQPVVEAGAFKFQAFNKEDFERTKETPCST